MLKQILFLIIFVLFTSSVLAFSGGDGTSGNPYQITNCTELQAMNTSLSSYFILNNNIDCSSFSGFKPVGTNIVAFTGNLNGNDKTISSLNISLSSANGGLFGYINNANISNLILNDIYIIATASAANTGSLVGNIVSNSNIENCSASGEIITLNGGNIQGGLIGLMGSGSVLNSYANVNITTSGAFIGGFIGRCDSGATVYNAYSIGTFINATNGYAGGFSGYMNGCNITNTYTTTNISSSVTGEGGFTSYFVNNPINVSNYWNNETSNSALLDARNQNIEGVTPKTIALMKKESTFIDWDFTNIWSIVEDTSYPTLQVFAPAPVDSCTYSSGDWEITISDNCIISDNVDIGSNNLIISGDNGILTINSNITAKQIHRIPDDFDSDFIIQVGVGNSLTAII